jgi:hypothetical protein
VSKKKRGLDELLDVWAVHNPGMWENELSSLLKDWFAVSSDDAGGIVAYFAEEKDAYRYRLDQINRELNG